MGEKSGNLPASHKEIALASGVSRATVSYALRNDPKISVEVRNRVLKIAKRLGYRPDPLVAKLMAHLRMARPRRSLTKVALLIPGYPRSLVSHDKRLQQMLAGAKKQAALHGFGFEDFWLEGESTMPLRRLQRILRARGFDGIVIGSMRHANERLDFDFANMACAAIGYSMSDPAIDRACPHHFKMMRGLLEEIRRRGFKRIGALYNTRLEGASNNLLSSAFFYTQRESPETFCLPLQIEETPTLEHVRAYLKRYRPDVLIGQGFVYGFLKTLGVRVPEDISFASIDLGDPPYDAAGIDGHYDIVAATAVDLVATQFTLNLKGVPAVPKVVMLDTDWQPGHSLGLPSRSKRYLKSIG
jgi:LacI family transcriptional regulator